MLEKIYANANLEKISFYSILLFALTLPLSRAAISFFIFWFILLVLLKKDYTKSFAIIKENPIFIYIGILVFYVSLTFFWSEDTQTALRQVRMYGYWIVIPSIAILAKREWAPSMLNAFLLGMFISEILAYGIFFELWSINGRGPNYPSPFMTHIHYSVFLAFTAVVLFYRILSRNYTLAAKLPLLFFFTASTTNLMFSIGRTGQLAFFIALFMAIFLRFKISLKSIFSAITLMLLLIFISYNSLNLFKTRVDDALNDIIKMRQGDFNTSLGTRAAFWIIASDIVKKDPLFGVGVGDYMLATKSALEAEKYKNSTDEEKEHLSGTHFHNQYLMIAVQTGIIGLFLMFTLIYKLLTLKIENQELKTVSILGFVVIFVGSIAEPLWLLQFPLALFLFIASLSIIASKRA
ncbi:MAG: O-antigen ligase family protein [Sulfurimonas sp.]|uniref:O-antigen ligase family protein n=1 Tax=Sulfurimonas sp. TaxID=2022749 RepID=UPI002632596F|nr:O-antigen ligase family protein [Sulfurimonas sp.]MDD5373988.1 O-antigen ligase family protein [Sulfurimonas sp.]